VVAGRILQEHHGAEALRRLAVPGLVLLVAGLAAAPVLPLNKHVWTPTYVVATAGIGLLLLSATHWIVDVRGVRRPFRPLEVLGLNAIVAFVLSELLFRAVLAEHAQSAVVGWLAEATSSETAAYTYPALSLLVIWAVCAALLRRGIVVRV
jgi:predicted acyltransferase